MLVGGDATHSHVYVLVVSGIKPSGPGVSQKGDETRWKTTVNSFQERGRDETGHDDSREQLNECSSKKVLTVGKHSRNTTHF